ncbi:MAG: NUDIX domain-containing protein [archaeon]|nr:NUDIX domain-containing protein [archaeon]
MQKTHNFITGTGLILPFFRENVIKYAFCIVKDAYWKIDSNDYLIEFSGIGGKLEGKETHSQAIIREACEEIGCKVKLLHSHKTFFLDLRNGKIQTRKLKNFPAPIIKFKKIINTTLGPRLLCNVVWLAVTEGEPKPSSEVPAIIFLTEELLNRTLERNITLQELLSNGAELIEAKLIPRYAIIKPFGTPEVIAKIFNKNLDLMVKTCGFMD